MLTHTSNQSIPLLKKIVILLSFICHLDVLCTCFGGWAIPVSVQGNLLAISAQTVFYLVSANPPNNLTLNQKSKLFLWVSRFVGWIFLWPLIWHPEAPMCVKCWLQKVNFKILTTKHGWVFSTLKIFTELVTLAASGGLTKILSLYVVHTKIFVWPSQNFLVFSSIFQNFEKVV